MFILRQKELKEMAISINVGNIDCLEFSNFIYEMVLLDLSLLGRSFTWYQPFDWAKSRMDMTLILNGWWELCGGNVLMGYAKRCV